MNLQNERERSIWAEGHKAGWTDAFKAAQDQFNLYVKEIHECREENEALRKVIIKLTQEGKEDGKDK